MKEEAKSKPADSKKPDDIPPHEVCKTLLETTLSLQLATLGEEGYPHCGYTPFVKLSASGNGSARPCFYIFTSELALHTRDLLRTPRASIMVIEDEASASQIFARTRVYYECDVTEVEREAADYANILDQYQQRHGKMVGLLRELPDFRLFGLLPRSGQFVMGFGKAFQLAGDQLDQFEHSRRA